MSSPQNLFVVGDVHGCLGTFQELLTYWKPAEELLIQVGDLVDRGRFSPQCVGLAIGLDVRYPGQTVFLKGNHEATMLQHYGPKGPSPGWLRWGGRETVQQYRACPSLLEPHLAWLAHRACPSLLEPHLAWLAHRPLFWQNEHVLVSHAGFADLLTPLDEEHPDGVLWRRGPLRNMGKRQVIGHTPTAGEPTFDPVANVLNIDTGACFGGFLTGVRLSAAGELLEELCIVTHPTDLRPE